MLSTRRRQVVFALALGVFASASLETARSASQPDLTTRSLQDALGRDRVFEPLARKARDPRPDDRYALAGGCYVARASGGRYVARAGDGFAATASAPATAERFHFQPYDLGKYLLFATRADFLAAAADPVADPAEQPADAAEGYVRGTGDETLRPARDAVLAGTGAARAGSKAATGAANDAARDDAVVAAARPSAKAEWVVRDSGGGRFTLHLPVDDGDPADPGELDPAIFGTLTAGNGGALVVTPGSRTGHAQQFSFESATGCAAWPEIELNTTGEPPAGVTPYAEVSGYVDAHLHMMAFEFIGGQARCGRPWHPYGVTYALVDCADHEPGGRGAVLESFLAGGTPGDAHDTTGWPTFGYWPKHNSLTHEQVYYRWLERSWRGGLRLFTNLLVDNGVLCELYPYKRNSCNEMDSVRLQATRLRQLERYIDAQYGGPGEGWFRIVTDPFEARRVINSGRLAVVMGIEVSVPLDCGETLGIARCAAADVERRLDEVYALGVRQMELTNKFDNAFTGVTGDEGSFGVVVNNGNKHETGHYWQMQTCDEPAGHAEHSHDKLQYNVADQSGRDEFGRDSIFGAVLEQFGGTGAAPAYPEGPHCNAMGLSNLGRAAIDGLMRRGMIFDPDHMSARARGESLSHLEAAGYSGVISSHSWADDPTYRRILALGGVVTPHAGGSEGFVRKWRALRGWHDPRYVFGVGFGSDINGFSKQGTPRTPGEDSDVDYPFTALGGVTVDRQVSGRQVFDINTDGVDHHGLYPDWVEDARIVAGADGPAFAADVARAAEAYLQMWERAIGVAPNSCREDVADLTAEQLKRLRPKSTPEQVLAALGQPDARTGDTFTYCGPDGRVEIRFGADGRVTRAGA